MSVKEFEEKFGIVSSIEKEKERFVNRIENTILHYFVTRSAGIGEYEKLFIDICNQLGENASSYTGLNIPHLNRIVKKDFFQTLKVVMAIYKYYSDYPYVLRTIDSYVVEALEMSNLNIGIQWKDGVFYPSGDKFLDKELIDTSLT